MKAAVKNCEQTMCAFSFKAQMQCSEICDFLFVSEFFAIDLCF